MKILFLEPFYGGSHKDVALGFKSHSSHQVTLITLPDSRWKWRMRGAAFYFADHIENISDYDVIFATDMMNIADFKALLGKDLPPIVMYFHENQLSYPLAPGQKQDSYLGFINITSAVVSDKVLFNSQFHFNEFITAAKSLIKQMPDPKPLWMIEQIKMKTQVVYPGCRFGTGSCEVKKKEKTPPMIIWNHRWEYDKNPEFFFDALQCIKEKNIVFDLVILGERPDAYPKVFDDAQKVFKDQIRVFGYVKSHKEYLSWLKKGSIVVSTAIQENFGISVVEAVRQGCFPLLPNRLSYPEIMPDKLHLHILYHSKKELVKKLEHALLNPEKYIDMAEILSNEMEKFSWESCVHQYDNLLENII